MLYSVVRVESRDGLAHRNLEKFPVDPSQQNLTEKMPRVTFFEIFLTLLSIFKDRRMKGKMSLLKKLVSRYGQSGHECIFVSRFYHFLSNLIN